MGPLTGAVLGAAVGTAQWLLLRNQVLWAGWWIPVSAVAWATGVGLAPGPGSVVLPRLVLSGVVPGAMTGLTLGLLFLTPKVVDEAA